MQLARRSAVLAWIATGWLGGLLLGAQWQPRWGPLFIGCGLAGSLLIAAHGRELDARLWGAPLAVLAFCCALGVSPSPPTPCLVRGQARLKAQVESVRHGAEGNWVRMRVLQGRVLGSGRPVLFQSMSILAEHQDPALVEVYANGLAFLV